MLFIRITIIRVKSGSPAYDDVRGLCHYLVVVLFVVGGRDMHVEILLFNPYT